jgi:tetratricopeptide (TPR) repeat protein
MQSSKEKNKRKAVLQAAFFLLLTGLILSLSNCNAPKQKEGDESQDTEQTDSINADTTITIESLTQEIRQNPRNAELYYKRSELYALQEKFGPAVTDIDIAIKLDSLQPDYYVKQAEYFIFNAQPNTALSALEKCLKIFPENTEVLLKKAEIHLFLREYGKAQLVLRDVALINNDLAEIYFLEGLIRLENKDTVGALRSLQVAVEKEPDFYKGYVTLGRVNAQQFNDLAIDYYNAAIDIMPDSYEARYNLALYYQDREMIEEAEEQYNYIIDNISQTIANPYYNMGYINMIYRQDFKAAIEWFTQAIEKEPTYLEAWYNRGFCHEVIGELKAARDDYKKSLEIKSDYALSIKGISRIEQGEPYEIK